MGKLTEQELEGLSRPKPLEDGKPIRIKEKEVNGNPNLPLRIWKNKEPLFPLRADSEKNMEIYGLRDGKETLRIWTVFMANKIVCYRCWNRKEDPPRFGRMMYYLYIALAQFQTTAFRKNGNNHLLHITFADALRIAGYPVTKENLKYARQCLETLALTLYTIEADDSTWYEEVGNLISYKNPPNKRGFDFRVNEGHVELMEKLKNGEPVRFVTYSLEALKKHKEYAREEMRILEYLMELRGLKKHFWTTFKKLFIDIGGYSEKKLENENPEHSRFYDDIWLKAIECGIIQGFPKIKRSKKANKDFQGKDYLNWKFRLTLAF